MNSTKLKRTLSVIAGVVLIVIAILYYMGVFGGSQDETQQTANSGQGNETQQTANSGQGNENSLAADSNSGPGSEEAGTGDAQQNDPQSGGDVQSGENQPGSESGQNGENQSGSDTQPGNDNNDNNTSENGQNTGNKVEYRFRTDKLLTQHYEKHGIEMGFDSKESYERAASDVINNPAALHKLEAEDGDYVYYVEETNEFAILSPDGYIRTYFLPSAGKSYYDRQ